MIELVPNERLDILFDERCLVCNVHCPRDEARKNECRILFKDGARAFEAEVGVVEVEELKQGEWFEIRGSDLPGPFLVRRQPKEKP